MMKIWGRVFTLLIILFFCFNYPLQGEEKTRHFQLENGLEVFCYERHYLPLAHVVVGVNVGSKDETEETNGLVHILEHCILFRGTSFRSGNQVAQEVRKHGAYFNAHTGRDLSLFEITVPSEFVDFALKNQKEILFNLEVSPEDLEKEKHIILEEISQIEDDPLKLASSLVYQQLFKNHPYHKPVYGNRKIIETATTEKLEQFHNKFFVPNNCALAVVGDFKMTEIEERIKTIFGDLKQKKWSPPQYEKVPALPKKVEMEKEMDVKQGYLVIGFSAPDYNHPHQYAVDLLTEIMGRGVNPLLNYPLQRRRIYVHSISTSYTAAQHGGAILINIIANPHNIQTIKREIIQFLKSSRNLNYSKDDYIGRERFRALDFLESAKNRIKHRFHQAQEEALNTAVSLVRYMLLSQNEERGNYLQNIEQISSTEIRGAAGKYLCTSDYVSVSILPQDKK